MPYPPQFSSTETYANRYDLDEIDVFLEGNPNNPMFFSVNGLPPQLSFGKHYFYLSTLDGTNTNFELRPNSRILFEFKSLNNIVLRSDIVNINQQNGVAVCYVDVLQDPLRTFEEIKDGEGTLTIVASLQNTTDNGINQMFPHYFEEFDINGDGFLDLLDQQLWIKQGRSDITDAITQMIVGIEEYPENNSEISRPPSHFFSRNESNNLVPYFFEEFDFDGNGLIDLEDIHHWNEVGRNDISQEISAIITATREEPPKNIILSRPIIDFYPNDGSSISTSSSIPEKFKGAMNYRCTFPIEIRKNLLNADSPKLISVKHKTETIKGQFSFAKANISPMNTSVSGMTYGTNGEPSNPLVSDVDIEQGGGLTS